MEAHRSDSAPSGLFSRAAFARAVAERSTRRPGWWADAAERDRRYAAWVEAESAGLLAQLGPLDGPGVAPALRRQIQGLALALGTDAAWAARTRTAARPGPGPGDRPAADRCRAA